MLRQIGSQKLDRRSEPSGVTSANENVIQYDQVMCTKLAIAYAAGLDMIKRTRQGNVGGEAIDLACGPGHFSLSLLRFLNYEHLLGVDLSDPMIATATANATQLDSSRKADFIRGNITDLSSIESDRFALASFTDAAHHMPDLDTVTGVLEEMERIVASEGLIFVMDLARLRTEKLTEYYVNTLASDYVERSLPGFFDDFRNSMYAAWTTGELRSTIPATTKRNWCHIVPRGLPTLQFLLGLPEGRDKPFLRKGWSVHEHPLIMEWLPNWRENVSEGWAKETLSECRLTKTALRFASCQLIRRV